MSDLKNILNIVKDRISELNDIFQDNTQYIMIHQRYVATNQREFWHSNINATQNILEVSKHHHG